MLGSAYSSLYMAPVEFHDMLDSGAAKLTGALIKETSSGRILAHVQETGLLQSMLSNVNLGSFSPLGAVNLLGTTHNSMQLNTLIGMTQTLTTLSAAGLGVGLVGVGVSVATAAMMVKRLEGVKQQLAALESSINRKFKEIEWREQERLLADVKSAMEEGDSLLTQRSAGTNQWSDLANKFNALRNRAHAITARQVKEGDFDLEVFEKIVFVQLMCRNAEIQCLLRCNEMETAKKRSEASSQEQSDFFDKINPITLVQYQMKEIKSAKEDLESVYQETVKKTMKMVGIVRGHVHASSNQSLLLNNLVNRRVDGQEYLDRLSGENQHPLLFIKMGNV